MSITYAGTTLACVAALPATNDETGFVALTFVSGTCALRQVPGIMREWVKVTEELVCADTNTDKKGSAKWTPVNFTMSRLPTDAAQLIYEAAEASRVAVISLKMQMPGDGGTIYFTAQVSKFTLTDGGGQDAYHSTSVELLIQSTPVFVAAP